MKLRQVRCWNVENHRAVVEKTDVLYITYPEDNNGYDLISCLHCGQIYAVDVSKMVYVGPGLEELIKTVKCISCGRNLSETYAQYPEKYLSGDRTICEYEKPLRIPSEEDSVIIEFPSIYG